MNVTDLSSDHSGPARGDDAGLPACEQWAPVHRLSGQRVRQLSAMWLLPLVDAVALTVLVVQAGLSVIPGVGYVVAVLTILVAEGQHRSRICLRVSDQVPRVVVAAALPLIAFAPWTRPEVLLGLSAVGVLVGMRALVYRALSSAHRRGRMVEPALIVGSGPLAERISGLLNEHPELGVRPRGVLDRGAQREASRLPVLGDPAELSDLVVRHRIRRVIVCAPAMTDGELVTVLRRCRPLVADVCVVPRLPELGMAIPRSVLDEVWGVPLIPLRRFGHPQASAAVKRAFDLFGGVLLLVLFAPLLIALALAVRVSSGTVFFRQQRVSRAGRETRVVKLRTVVADSEECWTVGADQCTRFGRWLRSTHLDELPQLFNVLRGDMSLVGPRPERPCYARRFAGEIAHYDDRHRMPGGLTGWAQVHGLHGDTSIPDRARFDNQYIEYWSPWLDLVIMIKTVAIVLLAAARSLAAIRISSGGGQGEGSACDHGARRRRRRVAAALDTPAHPS